MSLEHKTIRVHADTHLRLSQLATISGKNMSEIVAEATRLFEEKLYFAQLKDAYAKLSQQDREEIDEELHLWERADLAGEDAL
jgi:hypothetical protein